MLSEIDFEVLLHLSSYTNIDVCHRGVFQIKVYLFLGDDRAVKIDPVGCFSAPSTFDAVVHGRSVNRQCNGSSSNEQKTMTLWCSHTPLINASIDDSDSSFCGRAIIIRFKDEKHVIYK